MARKQNKNDVPLTSKEDLDDEINYEDFQYKAHFLHLCMICPNKEKECMELIAVSQEKFEDEGLVYVLAVNGKILKIGHTITNISARVQSYNCGKQKHREKGTCSTTNYFILQSILNLGLEVKVYAYFPDKQRYEIFGEIGRETFPSPKVIERKVLKDFKHKHNRLPIGCSQR